MPDARHGRELNRFWNHLLRDGPGTGDFALDPDEMEAVRRFQARGATPLPAAARDRAWREVLARIEPQATGEEDAMLRTSSVTLDTPHLSPNGRVSPRRPAWLPVPSVLRDRRRWTLAPLATAALVLLTLAAAYVALGPLRPGTGERPPQLPAVVATPTAGTAAAFEVLWESKGDPDLLGEPARLSNPYGLGVDPQGNVWVTDGNHDRIVIFAPDGTHLETWGTAGSGEGEFEFKAPEAGFGVGYGDVAFDGAGNIYVLDTGNYRVQKFAPDRSFLLAWGTKGRGDGQFIAAGGIVVGPDGVVYVSDEARADVQRFDAAGRFLGTTGPLVTDGHISLPAGTPDPLVMDGDRVLPAGVAVAGDGTIWVADYQNHQIQRFSPSGVRLDAWGRFGALAGEFITPNDVAIDAMGRIYVVDEGNLRVQVFDPDGRFLAETEGEYGDPGYLFDPAGVAVDDTGVVYVSDEDRVHAFRFLPSAGDA